LPVPLLHAQGRDVRRVRLLAGAHYGLVEKLSGSVGLLLLTAPGGSGDRGVVLSAEPGMVGFKAGLGLATVSTAGGGIVRLAGYRTWSDRGRIASHQSYLGGEIRLTVRFLTGGVGYFRRVQGTTPGDGHFFSASLGLLY
jgi:hypothetical protein